MTTTDATPASTSAANHVGAGGATRSDDALLLGALSCTIALLHISAAVGHMSESVTYGVLFILLATFQFGWGLLATLRPTTRISLLAGAGTNVVVVLVWVASRTVGLPFGPDLHHPESVGLPDLMATLDEFALIIICGLILHRPGRITERVYGLTCLLVVCSLLTFVVLAHIS